MVKINKYLMSYFRLFLMYLFHKKKIVVKDKIKTFLDYGFRLSISGEKSMLEIGSVYCREYVKFNINGGKLFLGNNIFFNSFSSINCQNEIIIGNDCLIGEGVRFYDHDHVFSLDKVLTRKSGFKAGSIKIGDNVWIDKNSHFIAGKLENKKEEKINQDLNVLQGHIILGNYIHIGINTIIQGHGGVEIGDYFTSSSNCCIYTLSNDPFKCKYGTYNGNVRDVFYINSPVQIESNVWLGLGVIVLGGKIGTNSFIKPHSIITKSIPANSIAQGSPAERVKFRFTIKEEY